MSSRFYISPEALNESWDLHWQAHLAQQSKKSVDANPLSERIQT